MGRTRDGSATVAEVSIASVGAGSEITRFDVLSRWDLVSVHRLHASAVLRPGGEQLSLEKARRESPELKSE